jgi:hypothetical protein
VWRVDLHPTRSITETELLLEGSIIGDRSHQFEEVFCIGHKFLADRDGVEATLIICKSDLTQEFVMGRSKGLWVDDDRKNVISVNHFKQLEFRVDVRRSMWQLSNIASICTALSLGVCHASTSLHPAYFGCSGVVS